MIRFLPYSGLSNSKDLRPSHSIGHSSNKRTKGSSTLDSPLPSFSRLKWVLVYTPPVIIAAHYRSIGSLPPPVHPLFPSTFPLGGCDTTVAELLNYNIR